MRDAQCTNRHREKVPCLLVACQAAPYRTATSDPSVLVCMCVRCDIPLVWFRVATGIVNQATHLALLSAICYAIDFDVAISARGDAWALCVDQAWLPAVVGGLQRFGAGANAMPTP